MKSWRDDKSGIKRWRHNPSAVGPSSTDYQGRTRKEVLAQIAQLNQLVEASKSDGEAGIGVRRDALERVLSLAMSISEKDIILSATAMLKAVMEERDSPATVIEESSQPPETRDLERPSRRQTQGSGTPQRALSPPPLQKAASGRGSAFSPSSAARRLGTREVDDRGRSASMMTTKSHSSPTLEKKETPLGEEQRTRVSVSPSRAPEPPLSPRSCVTHHLPLRFYDQQCGLSICQECSTTIHKGHLSVSLAEYAAQCRQELAETLAAARRVLDASEKAKLTKVSLP